MEDMRYAYRSSVIKRREEQAVVLSARLRLHQGSTDDVQKTIQDFSVRRRKTQPPGASMGSVFKNPPGDYAGQLIEAAGLKGMRVGGAQVSPLHANFIINDANATANDIRDLVLIIQKRVLDQSGITLETEVEFVGEWQANQ